MCEEGSDDSFDAVLAEMEMPTASKQKKIEKDTTTTRAAVDSDAPQTSKASTAPLAKTSKDPHCILVHPKQRGNPLLKHIVSVPLQFCDDILPDYVVGRTTCVLYLSLKYHSLNPDYICQRIKALGKHYELRVLVAQVDTPEPHSALKNLTRISLLGDLTLMLAWSAEEAGKMIETYKLFEKRPPDLIMEQSDTDWKEKLIYALTNIKSINNTDAMCLIQVFGTFEKLINATEDEITEVTGLGPRKAKNLCKTLQDHFLLK